MGGASTDINVPDNACSLDMESFVDILLLEAYESI